MSKLPKNIFTISNQQQLQIIQQFCNKQPQLESEDIKLIADFISYNINNTNLNPHFQLLFSLIKTSNNTHLKKIINQITELTPEININLVLNNVSLSNDTLIAIQEKYFMLIEYDQVYSIFQNLNLIPEYILENRKIISLKSIESQHRFVETYAFFTKATHAARCIWHTYVNLKKFNEIQFDKVIPINVDTLKPYNEVRGDTLQDVYYPIVNQPHTIQGDNLLKKLFIEFLTINQHGQDDRQKLLLDLAGQFIYDTCTFKIENNIIKVSHGANFYQQVCPFQLVFDLDFITLMKSYPTGVVLKTIENILNDQNVIILTVDYQTLLFLVFSSFGYFCNEGVPTGEDWGSVMIEDYVETIVENEIPLRKIYQDENKHIQEIKQTCANILVNCLSRACTGSFSEQAENQEVASLYFLNVSCQLLINRPTFLNFILDVMLQFGQLIKSMKTKMNQDKYNQILMHMVEPQVIGSLMFHFENCQEDTDNQEHNNCIKKQKQYVVKYIKAIIEEYTDILGELIKNKALGHIFKLLKQNKLMYKDLLRQMFIKLNNETKLYYAVLQTFNCDIIDDLICILSSEPVSTEIVVFYECIFHSKLQISETSLEIIGNVARVQQTYIEAYLNIHNKTQNINHFIQNFEGFENYQQKGYIIHQPLLMHHVLLVEKDVQKLKVYQILLKQWQNLNILDTFSLEFCQKILNMNKELLIQEGTRERILFEIVVSASVFNPTWIEIILNQFPEQQQFLFEIINEILEESKYFSMIDVSRGIVKIFWPTPEFDMTSKITLEYFIHGQPIKESLLNMTFGDSILKIYYEQNQLNVHISRNEYSYKQSVVVYQESDTTHRIIIEITNNKIQINKTQITFENQNNQLIKQVQLGSFSEKLIFLVNKFEICDMNQEFDLNPFNLKPCNAEIESLNTRQSQKFTYQQLFDNMKPNLIQNFSNNPVQILQIIRQFIKIGVQVDKHSLICIENGMDMKQSTIDDCQNFLSLCFHELTLINSYILNLDRYLSLGLQQIESIYDQGLNLKVCQYITQYIRSFEDLMIIAASICTVNPSAQQQQQINIQQISNFINKIMYEWNDNITKNAPVDLFIYILITNANPFQIMSMVLFVIQYGTQVNLNFDLTIFKDSKVNTKIQQLYQLFSTDDVQNSISLNWLLGKLLQSRINSSYLTQLLMFTLVVVLSIDQSPIQLFSLKQLLAYTYEYIGVQQKQMEFIDFLLLSMICQSPLSLTLIKSITNAPSNIGIFMLLCFCQHIEDQQVLKSILDTVNDHLQPQVPFLMKLICRLILKDEISQECQEVICNMLSILAEYTYQNKYDQCIIFGQYVIQIFKYLELPLKEVVQKVLPGLLFKSDFDCILLDFVFCGQDDVVYVRKQLLERQINMQFQTAISHLGMQKRENFMDLNDTFGELYYYSKNSNNSKIIFEVGSKFIVREIERISKIIDQIEKTEQTLRLFAFIEGLQAGQSVKLVHHLNQLITTNFNKLINQMEANKQELNKKLLETIPFNYDRKVFSKFEQFFDIHSVYDGFKTRMIMHQMIGFDDIQFFNLMIEKMPSKIKLSAKVQQQIMDYKEHDYNFVGIDKDIKKEVKLNLEETKKTQQLFIMMLFSFKNKKESKSKILLAIYIFRFAKLYQTSLSALPLNSELSMSKFISEIISQTSYANITSTISNSAETIELTAKMDEMFSAIQWDFRDHVDLRKLQVKQKVVEFKCIQISEKLARTYTKYQQTLDVRIVKNMYVQFDYSLLSNVKLVVSAQITKINKQYKAKVFAFNELYIIDDTSVEIIEILDIKSSFYSRESQLVLEKRDGQILKINLLQQYEPLRDFLRQVMREPSPLIEQQYRDWHENKQSNFHFLVSLSKMACIDKILLPKLFFDNVEESQIKALDSFKDLGHISIPGLESFYEEGEVHDFPEDTLRSPSLENLTEEITTKEEKEKTQQLIPFQSMRDLRCYIEHGTEDQIKIYKQLINGKLITSEVELTDQILFNKVDEETLEQLFIYLKALESSYVRYNLHYWVYLMFKAKNQMQSKLQSCSDLPIMFTNEIPRCLKKEIQKPRMLKNSYIEYVCRDKFLVCRTFQQCVYYDLSEQNCKPLPEHVNLQEIFIIDGQLCYFKKTDMNLIQVREVETDQLQFQFRPPGSHCLNIYFGQKYVYFVSDEMVVCYEKLKLQRKQPMVSLVLAIQNVDFIEEFTFNTNYLFIQQGSVCKVFLGEHLLYQINRVASRSQLFVSKWIEKEKTGFLLFDWREKLIKEQILIAKGQVDAFIAFQQLWVRGVKVGWYE